MQSRLLSLVGAISKHFLTIVLLIFVSLSGVFLGVTPSAIAASQSSTTMTAPHKAPKAEKTLTKKPLKPPAAQRLKKKPTNKT
uniref:Uncharacterized protein n=1 Tax=Desertifilum tharense IPPAS B-1220 TaxID=1781255 RepID=A0ACD5H0J1_9CYAN